MTDYNQDQLRPISTPFCNSILRGPPDTDIGDLPVELIKEGPDGEEWICSASGWEMDERQRELVVAGAHMRMLVWQHPIPPLALAIEAPFCGECTTQCIYVKSERAFVCPSVACDRRGRSWMDCMIAPDLFIVGDPGPRDEQILKDTAERADSAKEVEPEPSDDADE